MQMLDMNELFTIEIDRDEMSGEELNKLAEEVEKYENTEMSAVMINQKSTFKIGGYKSYHLNELVNRLQKRGLIRIGEIIIEEKEKKLKSKSIYV